MDTQVLALTFLVGFIFGIISFWCAKDVDSMVHRRYDDPAEPEEPTPEPPRAIGPHTDSYGAPPVPPGAPKHASLVRIVKCTDPMMWYAKHIGHEFVPEGIYQGQGIPRAYYWAREPSGLRNIVRVSDVEKVSK